MNNILKSDRDWFKGLFVIEAIIFLLLISYGVIPEAQPQIDMKAIKQIESRGNPNAVGEAGEVGLFQIMPIVRESYNQRTDHNYSRQDLFDSEINREIASWYLHKRIPEMLRAYNLEVSVKNIIWSYNAGIGRCRDGIMPEVTKRYLEKYRKLTDEP